MLTTRNEMLQTLGLVEQHAGRQLEFREQVLTLMELAVTQRHKEIFHDLMFLGKFLWNATNVMQRIGPESGGYPKLSGEYRDALEKFSTLVKTLVKDGPNDVKESFKTAFFQLSQESMGNIVRLAHDLSSLKNYGIDTKHPLFRP